MHPGENHYHAELLPDTATHTHTPLQVHAFPFSLEAVPLFHFLIELHHDVKCFYIYLVFLVSLYHTSLKKCRSTH